MSVSLEERPEGLEVKTGVSEELRFESNSEFGMRKDDWNSRAHRAWRIGFEGTSDED